MWGCCALGSPPSASGMISYIVSSKALAMTVVDLLCDGAREALRVKEEFRPIMTKEQYLREWGQLQ